MNVTAKLDHISSDFITQYLSALGIEDVKRYLKPTKACFENHWNYKNMDEAVNCLNDHISNKSKIGILVDEDADGYCSAVIAYDFLRSNSIIATPIFHKNSKAHGLVANSRENIVEEAINLELNLLWCPDSSSNDREQIDKLYANGIDCLITDHHLISTPSIHCVLINPFNTEGANINLSGAGVTYKVVQAFCDRYDIDICDKYLDLVAMSLVSDVCDLSSIENRAFLYFGLKNT